MAKRELETPEERDENQRSLGCVGASAIAHVGLLIAVALAPNFKSQSGRTTGTQSGLEFAGEQAASAAQRASVTSSDTGAAPQLTEVLLADANDPNAVALPATAPTNPTEAKTDARALAPVQEIATPATEAAVKKPLVTKSSAHSVAKIVRAAPKAAEKSANIEDAIQSARTQAAQAKPAPKIAETEEVATTEQGNVAVDQATDQATAQVTATDDQAATDNEKDDAVPVQIALPEKEALTEEQAQALQAPHAKVAETAATANSAAAPSLASTSATTKTAVNNSPTGPLSGQPVSTTSTGASGVAVVGSPTNTNGTAANSHGGGTGYSVPLGIPVRDARSLIAMPGNPKPVYPIPDKIAGHQGTTVLVGQVKNDGTVENVTLEKSSGSRLMDESAARAFKSWKYKPGQEGYVRLPVQFQLVGDTKIIPAQLQRQ